MAIVQKSKKRVCIFQMHYTDIAKSLKDYNAVEKIKKAGIFDHIVIAAADIPENRCLIEYANLWNVDIRFGSTINVTKRIYDIACDYKCETILRALVWWFFIDLELVERMVKDLEIHNADFCRLPYNFDIRFGGDIFSKHFLEYLILYFDQNSDLKDKYQFNPWGFVDLFPTELKVLDFDDVPVYGSKCFWKLKSIYSSIWPEQVDSSGSPLFPYQFASRFILKKKSKVLDLACGYGMGTKYLWDHNPIEVIGVDVSDLQIQQNLSKYGNDSGMKFIQDDALKIDFPLSYFDLIVSIHTMGHVKDDRLFLSKLAKWLSLNGTIVLEVPLIMDLPFKDADRPLSDKHIREYRPEGLLELFSRYFNIQEMYGVSRGYYTKLEHARNAIMLVGGKK